MNEGMITIDSAVDLDATQPIDIASLLEADA